MQKGVPHGCLGLSNPSEQAFRLWLESRAFKPHVRRPVSAHNQVIYIPSGGLDRRYVLHVPPSLPPGPVPVVMMLDGRGGTPWTAMRSSGWNRKADASHFVAVYPEALRLDADRPQHFLDNPQMWNAGAGGADTEREGADDVLFLSDVLNDLERHAAVDRHRVYLTGFSNGGSMVWRFAQEHAARVAALAPVACQYRPSPTPLHAPVPLLYITGALDPLNPVAGGEVKLPWGPVERRRAPEQSVRAWARLNGLTAEPVVEDSAQLTIHTYRERDARAETRFYVVKDLGHVWPGGTRLLPGELVGPESHALHGTDLIWDFFTGHARHPA